MNDDANNGEEKYQYVQMRFFYMKCSLTIQFNTKTFDFIS